MLGASAGREQERSRMRSPVVVPAKSPAGEGSTQMKRTPNQPRSPGPHHRGAQNSTGRRPSRGAAKYCLCFRVFRPSVVVFGRSSA
jgi:hypothetical protein